MNDVSRLCSGCVYWDDTADDDGTADARRGRCRRQPPVISASGSDVAQWPRTRADDWCGEWCGTLSPWSEPDVPSLEALQAADPSDPDEERWLRNVSMAQALLVLPAEKRDAVLEAVLTEDERQSPTPPDDFYDRVQLYFSLQRGDGLD